MESNDLELPVDEDKRQILVKRLIVIVVLLIKENPVLPLGFKFNGKCLLEKLKKERNQYKKRLNGELDQINGV